MPRNLKRQKSKPAARIVYEDARIGKARKTGTTLEGAVAKRVRQVGARVWLCAGAFALVYGGLGYRLATISLSDPGQTGEMRLVSSSRPQIRADIVDRNGTLLATHRRVKGLAIQTRDVWDAEDTSVSLAMTLGGIDPVELTERIKSRKYILLRKELSAEEQQRVLMLGLPGVVFEDIDERVYPQGSLAAHAVGHITPGKGGVMGLEGALDNQRDVGPVLTSTLDMAVQQVLEEELADTMQLYAAKAAWGVILEAKTGEVLALASLPDFNPNAPGSFAPETRRNRVMYDRYELGSAFKVITAAAALEEGSANLTQKYDVRHKMTIGGRTIGDFHPRGGYLSLSETIQYSSNIGMVKIAQGLGGVRQKEYFEQLNLLKSLQTELPEKRDTAWPRRWGALETATISYGHGIAVTPLHLAAAFAPVVNGGTFVTPTFIKGAAVEPRAHKVFSRATSAQMRLIMRRVVTDGTARRAEADGYYVIGKTATADKPSKGGYREDARLSSFIGAFPGYNPKYVMLVSFDEPQATEESWGYATAGIVAAPTFANIVARIGPALGLKPASDDLAFAGFMADLNANEQVQLASVETDLGAVEDEPQELDELGQFLMELGP